MDTALAGRRVTRGEWYKDALRRIVGRHLKILLARDQDGVADEGIEELSLHRGRAVGGWHVFGENVLNRILRTGNNRKRKRCQSLSSVCVL